jgi:hypothetical protein
MKGLGKKTIWALGMTMVLGASQGCYRYRELVDPCYPQRYSAVSRETINSAMAPQIHNGDVLDLTVWNEHFARGTDLLTRGGLEKLAHLARKRPHPDPVIYLQTAQDIVYDPANPEKMQLDREELNQKRRVAIERFMAAQASGRGVPFQVVVHDPPEMGLPATPVSNAVQQMYNRFQGGLNTGAAGGITGGITGGAGAPQ